MGTRFAQPWRVGGLVLKPITSRKAKLPFSLMHPRAILHQHPVHRHSRRSVSCFSTSNEKRSVCRLFGFMRSVCVCFLQSRTPRCPYPAPHCARTSQGELCPCRAFMSKIHVRVVGPSLPAVAAEIARIRAMSEHRRRRQRSAKQLSRNTMSRTPRTIEMPGGVTHRRRTPNTSVTARVITRKARGTM
jgi:hypothetical protein